MSEPRPTPSEQQPPQPEQPQPAKRPPLTPLQLRKRYLIEGVIVLVVCLWFVYDGWFNSEIHSKAFNKLGTVLLAWWFLYDMYLVIKYHRAASNEQAQPPQSPPTESK